MFPIEVKDNGDIVIRSKSVNEMISYLEDKSIEKQISFSLIILIKAKKFEIEIKTDHSHSCSPHSLYIAEEDKTSFMVYKDQTFSISLKGLIRDTLQKLADEMLKDLDIKP